MAPFTLVQKGKLRPGRSWCFPWRDKTFMILGTSPRLCWGQELSGLWPWVPPALPAPWVWPELVVPTPSCPHSCACVSRHGRVQHEQWQL